MVYVHHLLKHFAWSRIGCVFRQLCQTLLVLPLLSVAPTLSLAQGNDRVIIEIRQTASGDDDYLCWSPVLSRARLIAPEPTAVDVKIVSSGGVDSGAVEFAPYPGFIPNPDAFSPTEVLNLTLPRDGSWVPFLLAGTVASSDGQDVRVTAHDVC